MSFRLRKSTSDAVTLPLACDPAVIEANGCAEIARLSAIIRSREADLEAMRTARDAGADPELDARIEKASADIDGARAQLIEAEAPLAAYRRDHDPAAIVIPDGVTLFTVRPLTAAQRLAAFEAANGKPGITAMTAYAAIAFPAAVVRVVHEGETVAIRDFLELLTSDADLITVTAELVELVRALSGLDGVGKARSAPRCG